MSGGDLHNDARALDDYDSAIRLKPDFAAAYWSRRRLNEAAGTLDRARADFKKYHELRPADPDGAKAVTAIQDGIVQKK